MADINDSTVKEPEVVGDGEREQSPEQDGDNYSTLMSKSSRPLVIGVVIVALLLIIGGVLWATGALRSLGSQSGPVAIVNGQEISRADFDEQYNAYAASLTQNSTTTLDEQTKAQLKDQIVQGLISQTLVEKYAADNKLTVTDAEVATRYQEVLDQLKSSGQSAPNAADEAQAKDTIKENLLIEKAMDHYATAKGITITEDEIKDRYDQLVAQVPAGTNVPPLSEVHDDVRDQLKQEQVLSKLVDELRADADIKVLI